MDKTLSELLARGEKFLARNAVAEPRTVCELLAARLLACGRMGLVQHYGDILPERLVDALRRGLQRVARNEPVQYVLGQWDFRNLTLKTDHRALIPRPETEQLIDLVLKSPQATTNATPFVVDVGTGSGCIILSLAKEMNDGIFIGVDISPEALSLAQENAEYTGLANKTKFAQCEGCGEFEASSIDILVANPPYIASAVYDKLPPHIHDHEPRLALDGGPDGLDVYRALLLDAVMVLRDAGGIFLEIGEDQGTAIREMLEFYGFTNIVIHRDYSNLDRFATATFNA